MRQEIATRFTGLSPITGENLIFDDSGLSLDDCLKNSVWRPAIKDRAFLIPFFHGFQCYSPDISSAELMDRLQKEVVEAVAKHHGENLFILWLGQPDMIKIDATDAHPAGGNFTYGSFAVLREL